MPVMVSVVTPLAKSSVLNPPVPSLIFVMALISGLLLVALRSKTRTWPELVPLPSFCRAPMATVVPSSESETEKPLSSSEASPSMSPPSWLQVLPLQL